MAESSIRKTGPWSHRNVSAGGVSFHVAESGNGPHAVVLLHDFPLYWWSWRHQLPELAGAGYRAVAVDLRGFGGSDLQPGDVHLRRLATDVNSVIKALGIDSFTLVGAGMGGTLAWMLAHQTPFGLRSVVTMSSPHPLTRNHPRKMGNSRAAKADRMIRHSWRLRRNLQSGDLVETVLSGWSAPSHRFSINEMAEAYSKPMRRRFAAEAALSTFETTRHLRLSDRPLFHDPISIPTWNLCGALDPTVSDKSYRSSAKYVSSDYQNFRVPGAGRFLSEEEPEAVLAMLLEHLENVNL